MYVYYREVVGRILLALALVGCQGPQNGGTERPPAPAPIALPDLNALGAPTFPLPPAQQSAWAVPATQLGDEMTGAVATLFTQGLADPRECTYQNVRLQVGSVWGDGAEAPTHAFVFDDGKFAVAWNGVVYPVKAVGEPADLATDIEQLIAADEAKRAAYKQDHPDSEFYRHRQAWPEGMSTSHESLLPVKVALLLRLGEVALAERMWNAWRAGMRASTNDDAVHLRDPYLMLATDWIWAIFDRAVCAHMRGDDPLALESVRLLAVLRNAVEAEALRRGFERRENCGPDGCDPLPYLQFLAPLPDLVEDQERRAAQTVPARPGVEALAKRPVDERVAGLIALLDEVRARQWGQPGGVNLAEDPVVTALIDVGDAAVEPLIAVLERDERLTRSVHFHRDFFHHRSLLGTHEAAYAALAAILDADFFRAAATGDDLSARGPEGRALVAAAIREYWAEYGGLPPEERWYKTLADSDAGTQRWLEAAANIVQPTDVVRRGGWTTIPSRRPGQKIVLRGEPLRSKTKPSVTDLLATRVDGTAVGKEADLRAACSLAQALATWDSAGARLPLATLITRAERAWARLTGWEAGVTAQCIADLTLARVRAGDQDALEIYAKFIARTSPDTADRVEATLAPLWLHAEHDAIQRAADELFGREESRWLPLLLPRGGHGLFSEVVGSKAVELPAVRARLRHELTLRHRVGAFRIQSTGGLSIEGDAGWSIGTGVDESDPRAPKPGDRGVVRYCDLLAHELARSHDQFKFEVYWPVRDRNRALATLRKQLSG